MASDPRLFFKLHNGFPEHPKTIELSDKAFRQLVEAWCYCSRQLNDGKLTKPLFLKLFSAKSRKELLEVGFVIVTENGYEMHDYLEHQQSAEDVKNRRNKRAEAGSKGGKAKANNLASATANASDLPKQTGSKPVADIDTDTEVDIEPPPKGGEAPRKRATRATRISDDFKVTEDMRLWASVKAEHVNLDLETEKFINFWISKSGKDATKLDWTATWRNWILNSRSGPSQPQQRQTHADRVNSKHEALIAKLSGQTDIYEIGA